MPTLPHSGTKSDFFACLCLFSLMCKIKVMVELLYQFCGEGLMVCARGLAYPNFSLNIISHADANALKSLST